MSIPQRSPDSHPQKLLHRWLSSVDSSEVSRFHKNMMYIIKGRKTVSIPQRYPDSETTSELEEELLSVSIPQRYPDSWLIVPHVTPNYKSVDSSEVSRFQMALRATQLYITLCRFIRGIPIPYYERRTHYGRESVDSSEVSRFRGREGLGLL